MRQEDELDLTAVVKKDVPGWPGYKATAEGVVLSKSGRPLYFSEHYRTKHRRVRLYGPLGHRKGTNGGMFSDLYVHQVVCMTFHGPRPFSDALVRHLDNDVHNNFPENLCWGTHQENSDDYWSNEECIARRQDRADRVSDHPPYEVDERYGF